MGARCSTALEGRERIAMTVASARCALLCFASLVVCSPAAAQTATRAPAPAPAGATAAWTARMKGDIRWQQVTPAGALLVSTDAALAGVDIRSEERRVGKGCGSR